MRKHTVLMLSDNPLSTSGVATQARYLINGLLGTGKYRFRCFGGSLRNANHDPIVVNDDFIVKPTDGFGTKESIKAALIETQPDVLLLFTDPRFFLHVFEMQDEITQYCPIAYWHLWDNKPWPEFNRVLYESTDLINCINYPTYEMIHEKFPNKTNYIPHAVPKELFFEIPLEEAKAAKARAIGEERVNEFACLYVGRNAYRKMTPDLLVAWSIFLKGLKTDGITSKPVLIMHTDPYDVEGGNLVHIANMTGVSESVVFSNNTLEFNDMRSMYNVADVVINVSKAEGFGLPVLEAKMCARPVIAITTGGLTRQIVDHESGEEYGVAVKPVIECLVGTQTVPYIYESIVDPQTVAKAIRKMYDMSPEARRELGRRAQAHALKNYDLGNLVRDWDSSLTRLITSWKRGTHPGCKRHEFIDCSTAVQNPYEEYRNA